MPEQFANLPVADLAQGENVRFQLSEIEALAADIRRRGVLQPIVVIPSESGDGAEVLIGHRRLAAAQLAGLETIPAVLRRREPDVARLLDQVSENAQRVNLSPIEEATACKALADDGLSPTLIGVQMQKSDTWVINRIRLLNLPQSLQDGIHKDEISVTKALDILPKLDTEGVERLDALIEKYHDASEGVGAWWRDHYARRDSQRRETEAARAAAGEPDPPPESSRYNFEKFQRPVPQSKPPPGAKFSLTVYFDADDAKLLDALVKASTVFEKKAQVVAAMLAIHLEQVRDELGFGDGWEQETLRHCNGMTDEEVKAYDAASDARHAAYLADQERQSNQT